MSRSKSLHDPERAFLRHEVFHLQFARPAFPQVARHRSSLRILSGASLTRMSASSVRRGYPLRMTANPPTTAKSMPLRARSANNFSNREIVSLGSGECSVGILANEGNHVFQADELPAGRRRPANRFANRLLHWLDLDVHGPKLCASTEGVNSRKFSRPIWGSGLAPLDGL